MKLFVIFFSLNWPELKNTAFHIRSFGIFQLLRSSEFCRWELNFENNSDYYYFRKTAIVWIKTNNNDKWLFYCYFWPFFRQLYVYLSQNWDSEGHFDVPNRSKNWLVLRLSHKMQIFQFLVCCNFVQKHAFEFFVFLRFVS